MNFDFRTKIGAWIDQMIGHILHAKKMSLTSFLTRHWIKLIALALWIVLLLLFFRYKRHAGVDNIMLLDHVYVFLDTQVFGPLISVFLFLIRPLFFFPASGLVFLL